METQLLVLNYKLTEITNLILYKTMYDVGEISKEELLKRYEEVTETAQNNIVAVLERRLETLRAKARSCPDPSMY